MSSIWSVFDCLFDDFFYVFGGCYVEFFNDVEEVINDCYFKVIDVFGGFLLFCFDLVGFYVVVVWG